MLRNRKLRFILVVPYLMLTIPLLIKAHFFPDYSLFSFSASDSLLLILMAPWIFLFAALGTLLGLAGNFVDGLIEIVSVGANAAILYYIGHKFERAPENLFH